MTEPENDNRPEHTRDLGMVYAGLVCLLMEQSRNGYPETDLAATLKKIEAFELLFPEVAAWFQKQ